MPGVLKPVDEQQQAEAERHLNIVDALAYLDLVKNRLINQPQVYEDFMKLFDEFGRMTIDTPGVVARMSNLLAGHPDLLVAFKIFLPPGYEFDFQSNGQPLIQPAPLAAPPGVNPGAAQLPAAAPFQIDPVEEEAASYIMQVKHRFIAQPQVYNYFLHSLVEYRSGTIDDITLNTRVLNLFEGHPDLIVGIRAFFRL